MFCCADIYATLFYAYLSLCITLNKGTKKEQIFHSTDTQNHYQDKYLQWGDHPLDKVDGSEMKDITISGSYWCNLCKEGPFYAI